MSARGVPTVTADGLVLAPFSPDDAAGVLTLADDPESRAWSASLAVVHTLADARGWIANRTARPDAVSWAVRDPGTGELVGRVGLIGIDEPQRSAEIGYGVRADRRGGGVATRAVAAAAEYGYRSLGLQRIALLHAVGNVASCRVARATGFAYEGTERSAFDHGDGVRHDAHRHARLASDPGGPLAQAMTVSIEPVELVAGRIMLRPPSVAEADDLLAMASDPEMARWNAVPATDPVAAADWLDRAADWSGGGHATFSVLDATAGRLLGTVSVFDIDHLQRDAEVGYRVAAWARGQGVATQAVRVATGWAFDGLGLDRIRLFHSVQNAASCRVAVKSGFPLEGTLRGSHVYGDGERHDEHLHARLADDPEPV